MKHAGPEALAKLKPLLGELRKREPLREKRPGIFNLRSRAFLHFHEDPTGLFADVRLTDGFSRHPVDTSVQRNQILRKIDRCLASSASEKPVPLSNGTRRTHPIGEI